MFKQQTLLKHINKPRGVVIIKIWININYKYKTYFSVRVGLITVRMQVTKADSIQSNLAVKVLPHLATDGGKVFGYLGRDGSF